VAELLSAIGLRRSGSRGLMIAVGGSLSWRGGRLHRQTGEGASLASRLSKDGPVDGLFGSPTGSVSEGA